MIGKVVRGCHAGGLLRYLYGPGRANEHIHPHLVAGFGDPAELEPDRPPGGAPDLRRLAGLLAQPLAALGRPGYDKPVWHCSVRAVAVAELRQAQPLAVRAAAARTAAEHLRAAAAEFRSRAPNLRQADVRRRPRRWSPADVARYEAAPPPLLGRAGPAQPTPADTGPAAPGPRRTVRPPTRPGPHR